MHNFKENFFYSLLYPCLTYILKCFRAKLDTLKMKEEYSKRQADKDQLNMVVIGNTNDNLISSLFTRSNHWPCFCTMFYVWAWQWNLWLKLVEIFKVNLCMFFILMDFFLNAATFSNLISIDYTTLLSFQQYCGNWFSSIKLQSICKYMVNFVTVA